MATERLILPFNEAGVPTGFVLERVTLANLPPAAVATDGEETSAGEEWIYVTDGGGCIRPAMLREIGYATDADALGALRADEDGLVYVFDTSFAEAGEVGALMWPVHRVRFDAGPIARRELLLRENEKCVPDGTILCHCADGEGSCYAHIVRTASDGTKRIIILQSAVLRSAEEWEWRDFDKFCEDAVSRRWLNVEFLHVYTRDMHELK